MGVAVGRLNLEESLPDIEDGDIKSSATQIIDGDLFVLFLVQAVGQRGGRGLIDDSENFQPGNLARVLGRLALAVIKISRNRDYRLGDFLPQLGFRIRLQLGEDEGGDLLG